MSVTCSNVGGLGSTYSGVINSTMLYVFRVLKGRLLLWLFGAEPKKYTEKISNITIKLTRCTEVTLAVSSLWKMTRSNGVTLEADRLVDTHIDAHVSGASLGDLGYNLDANLSLCSLPK